MKKKKFKTYQDTIFKRYSELKYNKGIGISSFERIIASDQYGFGATTW